MTGLSGSIDGSNWIPGAPSHPEYSFDTPGHMQDPITVFLLMRTRLLLGTIKRLDPSCIGTTAPLSIKLTSSNVSTSLPISDLAHIILRILVSANPIAAYLYATIEASSHRGHFDAECPLTL